MIFVYKRCIIRCTASFLYPLPFSSARSRHPAYCSQRPHDRAIRARAYAPAVLKRPRDRAIRARAYAPAVLKRPRDRAIRARAYDPSFSSTARSYHPRKKPSPIFSAPTAHRCSFPQSDRSHANGPPMAGCS